MAVISVPSSATGATYSVRIAGDTPTAAEQARIDAYVAQMDASMAPVAPPPEETGPDTSFTGALRYAFDQPLENMAITSKALGGEGIASFLSGLTEAPAGYQPASEGFMNEDGSFFDFSYLPRAAVEQAGQFAGSIGTRAAGALLGGAAGTVIPGVGNVAGAAAGAIAGPALFEGIQVLGPVALERAKNNGRDEPNADDWLGALSTAGVSGALNAIAPGLSGFVRKTIAEAGTEGLQSIVQQAGETAATDVGLEIDPRQAAAEAILGGTAAGAITAPFAIAESRAAKREAARTADEKAIADLEEDQKEEAEDAAKRIAFGDAAIAPPPTEEAPPVKPVALLPAPVQTAAAAPAPQAPAAEGPASTVDEVRRTEARKVLDEIRASQQRATSPEVGVGATEAAAPQTPVSPTAPTPDAGTQPTQESLVTPEAPRPAQPFRWRDYTAATQAVVNAKDASVPAIQKAASADPKKPVPPVVAKAIRDRMVADGVIVADKKSKGGFRVVPTRVPQVDQTESYRRTLDDLQQDTQEATAAQQKALLDARRAEQTGSKTDARKFKLQADAAAEQLTRLQATRQEVEARLPRAAAETAVPRTEAPLSPVADGKAAVPITEAPPRAQATAVSDRAKRLKQSMDYYQREAARKAAEARRLRESGKKVQLPKSDQQRMLDLERDAAADSRMAQGIRAALARPASDIEQDRVQKTAAAAKEASVAAEAAARAPIYTAKEGQLFTAFRRRLDNLGLSDVKLVAERVIRPANAPQNALIEGMMEVDRRNGNRIISLALGVYDPKMTQQELFDAISAVMNHEVIHAIRSLGLFTDGEWKTLSDLAARQRYMKVKDGKSVERGYTYLQRAQQMYANDSAEIQAEEAVAEMFRDYVSGRLKIGGKPKTLMDRIKGFFRALWGAHAEAGLTDPNAIFEGVRFGDIGKRERKAAAPSTDEARLSRVASRDAFLAGNHPDVPDVLYHGNAPRVVENQKYLGDGKWDSEIDQDATDRNIAAQDFSEFKPSRYGNYGPGIYLSDSPKTASGYAQGIRADQPEIKPYGQVMKLNVSMKQPFTDDTLRIPAWRDYIKGALTQYSIAYDEDRNARDAILKALDNGTATVRDLFLRETPQGTMVNQHGQHDIHDVIRNSGFDGIIAGRPDGSKEYVAFKPEQVKSALSASRFDSSSPDMRMSRIAAERAPSDPNYVKWSNGPNGERAVVNANGTPVVYYTGTSKDQDFTSFKVSRHGGWFTTDPDSASQYAFENDSQGFTRDGWDMVPKNTKPRVIPAFLRAANPFTGPLPQSAYAENYKKAQSDWFDTLRARGHDAWMPSDQPGLMVILRDGDQVKSVFARGTGGRADMRRYSRLIATDNPGGSWLENKRRRAEEDMRTAEPGSSSSKGVTGAITAYMPKPVNLPVDILSSLTGANDEVRRAGDARYDELAADVARRGFVPDQDGNAVVVGVNHLGQAYLKEGNTRVAVARDFGVPSVRAEVRWFNGGELADGPFSPAAIERLVSGDTRYSMISLSDKDRKLTVLDRYEQGRFRDDRPRNAKGIPVSTRSKESAMVRLQADRGNKVFESNETNKKVIARLMAAEAEAALNSDRSAIGWYDAKLRAAKSVLALLHPEIATDPGANAAMDYATAVTSNGMAVVDNYRAANEQYEYWQKNGRFLVRGYGNQGKSMEKAFSFYNKLKDRGMTDAQISDYLSQDTTVAELRKNDIIRELGIEIDSKEFAAAKVKVSYVIGPKIGQGFYQNLRGNFEPLTMDRWWMRMFNRLTGNPFVVVTDENLKNNADRVVLSANEPLNDYEREVIEQAKLNKDIDMVTEGNALEFAKEVDRIFQKAYKDADEGQRPEKTRLFLAAGRYKLNSSPQLEESPRGPGDRQFMRETTNVARKYLKDATGVDITPADLQALLWYAEKRLWDSLGIRKGQGEDNDYVDGAIALLRNKGYGDDSILEALPAGERFRIDPVRYPAGQDGSVRGPDAEGDTSKAETRLSAIPAAAGEAGRGRGDGGRGRTVRGAPPLEGAPRVQGASGPDQNLVLVAEKYARENGIDLRRQGAYVDVDEALAGRIADAFEAMEHDPSNPQVKAAYAELIKQTRAQYDALADAGYKFWFIDKDANKAYASTPWNAMRDIRKNKTMGVFPSISGFGTREEVDVSQNPLLEETELMWPYGGPDGPKVPVLANDLFRAVHDAFGHGIEGSGFRARGEENAWQAHIRLFTGLAKGALTTETRGQNSWLNYGPFGEQNRKAKVEDTIFADQKVGLMPEWTWKEGLAPDGDPYSPDTRMSIRYAVSPITANMRRNIQASQKALMYASTADVLAGLISKTRLADKEQAKKFTDGVLRRFQDSMLPIGRMVQELSAKGLTITDAMDTYLQENLMHGRVGDRISANKAGLYEPVSKAIKRINVPKARIDQLVALSNAAAGGKGYVSLSLEVGDNPRLVLANAYLYAAHARERNRYIKANKDRDSDTGSGMSDAEASAIIQWFAGLDPANRSAIDALEKGIRLIVADTNQTRVDGGLISSAVVDPYNFYVPLRGLLDQDNPTNEDDSPGNRTTPGLGARGREDRRATGRYDYATDIVANVFAQNSSAIVRAERNKVGQSFLNLLRSDPSMTDDYAEVLPYAPKKKESRNGKMVEVPDQKAYDDPNILVVKEDGKETFVRFVDTTMAGAMNGKNGLSIETGRGVIGLMGKINRYLATINTSYNPEFIITNMIRDLTTAGVQINQFEMSGLTADALRGVPSALKGIRSSIRDNDNSSEWAKIYRDFAEAGGQNSTNQMNSIADYMDEITSMLGDISQSGIRGKWSSVKNGFVGKGVGSILDFLEDYNTVVENGIRVSAYKALLDRGVSRERAAQAARNVTVNFAKRGDYGQLMGAFYLFYNASIQGSFALLNAATRSRKVQKILLGVAASGFVMDAVNAMLSGEDEDGERIYDKIPDHVLEHNLVIMDFLGASDRGYITIPLPYGINMPFNTGRALSRYSRDGYSIGEAGTSIMSTVLDVINPLGGTESFENFAAPTVLDPVIDVLGNEDFASKPIYKEGLPFDRTPAPVSQLYWSTTSPSAIWIANNLNSLTGGNEVRPGLVDMSPDIIQFWFEFVTGGIGRFAMNSAEVPFTVAEEGITAENIRNIPFVKKVVGSVSEREDMTSYIEGAKQILTAGEELKRARETGDAAWVKQTIGRYGKELRLVGPMRSFESALREVSKMRNRINDNPNIPDEQKKVLLDRLEERRQMILSRANSLIRQAGL